MPYIARDERTEKSAGALARLLNYPDFQLLRDVWLSDLVDKQAAILSLDGTELSRAQGAAVELKRILESMSSAVDMIEKLSALTAQRVGRQHSGDFVHVPPRQSDQP